MAVRLDKQRNNKQKGHGADIVKMRTEGTKGGEPWMAAEEAQAHKKHARSTTNKSSKHTHMTAIKKQ